MNKISNVNNVQFNGINLRKISQKRRLCQEDTAGMLSQSISDVVKLTRNVSRKRMAFWESLAVNYNRYNYYRKPAEKEDSKLVNEVFGLIKRPQDIHRYIVHNFADSFQNIERIFKGANNKKERLEFVKRVNKDVFAEEKSTGRDLIPELLESPYSKEYIKHYDDIKSYLILHKKDPDAVRNLDSMYERGLDGKIYDNRLKEEEIKKSWNFANTDILNADKYFENYSESVEKIVSEMSSYLLLTNDVLKSGGDKYVLDIMKSTTNKNLALRLQLLKAFCNKTFLWQGAQDRIDSLRDIVRLFDVVENNKHAKNFVSSFNESNTSGLTLTELNKILENIPASRLNIFKDNAKRIISLTKDEARIDALKNEITNPFFETEQSLNYKKHAIKYGYITKKSFLKGLMIRTKNYYNIFRASLYPETKPVLEKVEQTKSAEPLVIVKVSSPEVKNIDKKAEVKDNVLSFVTKKLGAKTFDRQKDAFGAGATKMRLSMLPEIFASVADTRKADRAIGKQKINSSNKDVLDLYLRINGNNKKFVNYLLKKRNVDNTRMFEVKEIIKMLDKAEAKIKANKASNPEYRARDARRYYNHLYEAKIQQYGKLSRTRNK